MRYTNSDKPSKKVMRHLIHSTPDCDSYLRPASLTMDNEIVSQIILSCQSQRLRRRALRETMTLNQLLTIGRSFETSEREADLVEAGRQEATYKCSQ